MSAGGGQDFEGHLVRDELGVLETWAALIARKLGDNWPIVVATIAIAIVASITSQAVATIVVIASIAVISSARLLI